MRVQHYYFCYNYDIKKASSNNGSNRYNIENY